LQIGPIDNFKCRKAAVTLIVDLAEGYDAVIEAGTIGIRYVDTGWAYRQNKSLPWKLCIYLNPHSVALEREAKPVHL